jgi:hypothetical protein
MENKDNEENLGFEDLRGRVLLHRKLLMHCWIY